MRLNQASRKRLLSQNLKKMPDGGRRPDDALLHELATATRLNEGPEGVRKILRSIYRQGPVPIRDLARDLGIPVPVVAAVRGELEKRGLAERQAGVVLTEAGVNALRLASGITSGDRYDITAVLDLPDTVSHLVDRFAAIAKGRPDADVRLDQSHASAETAIRRAVYLYEHDAVEGRSMIFVGDDDLTSIAVGMLAAHLGAFPRRLCVLDIDDRLVDYISSASSGLFQVDTFQHDLRDPLPVELESQFDVFFTDPPYTIDGLRLFVERGVRALKAVSGKLAFISFGRKSPSESVDIARTFVEHDLALIEVTPDFNRYDGAQLLAGSSQMIRSVYGGRHAEPGQHYAGPLYTRDRRGSKRD